jgi:hypothetical protein
MASKDFTPKILRLDSTKTKLTSAAGLGTLIEAFDVSPLSSVFEKCLPDRSSNRSQGSYRLGLIQLASFVRGHDCIEDLIEFRHDETLFQIMRGETVVPRTMGDFLRDFEDNHLASGNQMLSKQAIGYRKHLERHLKKPFKPSLAPRLSIDSTSHVQRGHKMEGLAYNYKDEWCLDTQIIFDELGFCWDFELRPGNTKSGVGACEQVRRAFASYKFADEKYLSGDSAYCYQEMMKTCLSLGVKFTFTANQATTGWEDHITNITNWQPWVYSEAEKQYAAERGIELPEIEVGRLHWRPSWNQVLLFPIVVKRTKQQQADLFHGAWKYYGVVTNMDLTTMTYQQVIEFHNKRGNAENFIREEKYGYDLKHFPCLKLKANHAFGFIAMVAHNLVRWGSIHDQPHRPRFAKGFRRQFINIPGKMVSHGRTLTLKIAEHYLQEVNRLRMALRWEPCSALVPTPTG